MRRVALALFGTVAGLVGLLSFKTHPASVASPPAAVGTTGSGTGSSGTSGSAGTTTSGQSTQQSTGSSTSATPKTGTSSSSGSTTRTVTGSAVDTQNGPVQVRITVRNGKVVSATAIEYPMNDPRDAQINSYAIPILEKESAGVSSANIDTVSGATFTSEGYLQSLQSALDSAGI
jgi:uncharacterized protein with FMN-binding domain